MKRERRNNRKDVFHRQNKKDVFCNFVYGFEPFNLYYT